MEQHAPYIITGIFGVIIALIELRTHRDRKREQIALEKDREQAAAEKARAEARQSRRAEESRLAMEMMDANCKLATICAKKLTDQHVNGDVEEAMEASRVARCGYEAYTRDMAAVQTAKI